MLSSIQKKRRPLAVFSESLFERVGTRHDRSETKGSTANRVGTRHDPYENPAVHFPQLSTGKPDKRDTRARMIYQVACRCPATTSGIPVTGSYIITVYTFHDGNMTESASTLNIGLKDHNRWHVRSRGDNPTVSRGLICPLVGIAKPGDPVTS